MMDIDTRKVVAAEAKEYVDTLEALWAGLEELAGVYVMARAAA